ncbi:MAG TPA: glutamyl-Q tRNA(Asp) synthetase [Rhodanobacteraceae bacterium]|nr:glutamyl-Q tRNA(Asp) synthetase [Rhodanobacteraceae bacterium]
MAYRGRFAPSPTGHLHFGSLVAAVASWLCARHADGDWLLRVEDIDPPREVPGSAAAILAALERFGLGADAPPLYQSTRTGAYRAALERLRAGGHAFPCWCSRGDLATAGGAHRDGICVATADPSRPPAWRVRADDGDFVLRRADGCWAYQLACVVDDAFQGITEVVRGCDLLDSTPRQIHLQRLLGLPTPRYRHIALVLDDEGRKLSKSDGDAAIGAADPLPALREALAFLGVPPAARQADTTAGLLAVAVAAFDPARLPRSRSFLA